MNYLLRLPKPFDQFGDPLTVEEVNGPDQSFQHQSTIFSRAFSVNRPLITMMKVEIYLWSFEPSS